MKSLRFTRHALFDRMPRFGLTREAVEAIVRQPDWIEPDPDDQTVDRRFGRPPDFIRYVRVACVEEEDHIRVLSAFPDRNARPPDAS
jgi:hypothetical protein